MTKTRKRITGITVSAMMLISAALPATQSILQEAGVVITASAADYSSDMVSNPSRYFQYSTDPNNSNQVRIYRYIGNSTVIRIPGTINGKKVIAIDSNWRSPFIDSNEKRDSITKVIIDNNVKEINSFAFANCHNLESVSIPSSVTYVDRDAFTNCTGLRTVTFGSNLANIDSTTFMSCTNLTNAGSVNSAFTLLRGGAMKLATVNGSQITYSQGNQEPYLMPSLSAFILGNYEKMDEYDLIKNYERYYAAYIVHGRLGITNSMSEVQRAARIVYDMKSRVVYDTQAWGPYYENGRIVGYGPQPGYSMSDIAKTHCAGSALWGNKTVCEGYSKALSLLFTEAGLTNNYLARTDCYNLVYQNGQLVQETGGHEFNVVLINSEYYIIDATSSTFDTVFMNSAAKQKILCNTAPLSTWDFASYRVRILNDAEKSFLRAKLTNELGDLNHDSKVNVNDYTILSNYLNGSTSTRNSILNQLNVSKAYFEMKADLDGNGVLNYNDKDQLQIRYQRNNSMGYV